MKRDFEICKDKIIHMLNFMHLEYERIIGNYDEDIIIKKSIPIKASKKLSIGEQKKLNELMYNLFSPSMKEMAKLIDNGIIEWSEVSKKVELSEIIENETKIIELIYEAHEKMYFYKHIKYNFFFEFLMQMYLFFEKEICKFSENTLNFQSENIFSFLRVLEENFDCYVNSKLKKTVDLYKNIINVYKHGYGQSFLNIVSSNHEILNYTEMDADMSFVFNMNKISIEEFFWTVKELVEEIHANITN